MNEGIHFILTKTSNVDFYNVENKYKLCMKIVYDYVKKKWRSEDQ